MPYKIPIILLAIISISYCTPDLMLRDPFRETKQTAINIPSSEKEKTYIYNTSYREPKSLAVIIKEIYPDICISCEEESRQIVFKTSAQIYQTISKDLKKLDIPLEQIMIELKVVELSENNLADLGISWKMTQDGIAISEAQKTEEMINKIMLLVGSGKGKIKASPKITTLTSKEACIKIGDKIPYTIPIESTTGKTSWDLKYIDTGVNVTVTPFKAESGYVLLQLKPSISSIKQWKQTPGGEYPIMTSRTVESHVRLKNNETCIIGGLLNEEERANLQKVPLLGDIPLLNIFFQHTVSEKITSDVIFLVTAKKIQ